MTPEGLFELTIMFFRLINSLAILQTIVNEILQDLINIRKIASFIDDIIVVIERTNSCIRVNTRELDKEPFTK